MVACIAFQRNFEKLFGFQRFLYLSLWNKTKIVMTQTTLINCDGLKSYGLVWDLCANSYLSTYCPSLVIAKKVVLFLSTIGVKAHQMTTDKKIVVVYL